MKNIYKTNLSPKCQIIIHLLLTILDLFGTHFSNYLKTVINKEAIEAKIDTADNHTPAELLEFIRL